MGIVMNRIPSSASSPTTSGTARATGHGVATSHIMGEIMAKAMSGSLEQFDTFARCKHLRVPLGDLFGNPMLAAGMWYYQLMEKLR